MFVRSGKILVVLALILTTGLHWAALQTVAWTTMLANNLRTQSVTESVSKTFDGEHPCCLCKAIAAARQAEQKSAAVAPVLKMKFPPTAENTVLSSPSIFELLPLKNSFAGALSSKPQLPPPRSLAV
jgi:hypothetical protein